MQHDDLLRFISMTCSAMSWCAGLYVAQTAALLSAASTDDDITCATTAALVDVARRLHEPCRSMRA